MKILLANNYWYPRGGAERVVFLTKEVLEDAGHEVFIFGMQHPKNSVNQKGFAEEVDFEEKGIAAKLRNAEKFIYNHEAKKRFEQKVHEVKPDLVHFHNIYHHLSFSLLGVVRSADIPSVMTLHDYKIISPNYTMYHHGRVQTSAGGEWSCARANCMESFPRSMLASMELRRRRKGKLLDAIDAFIAPSVFMKETCVAGGIEQKRIHVVPNSLSDDQYQGSTPMVGDYVAYIGRLSEEKGLLALLEAAAEHPEIPLCIAGSGPQESELRAYVSMRELKHVTFLGYQSGRDLENTVANARFLIVPSVWYENCPLSILEAMSLGKVVLGSDIGGIPELLEPGMLVKPGDVDDLAKAMKSWYGTPSAEIESAGRALKKKVLKHYDKATYANRISEVYASAIGAHKNAS